VGSKLASKRQLRHGTPSLHVIVADMFVLPSFDRGGQQNPQIRKAIGPRPSHVLVICADHLRRRLASSDLVGAHSGRTAAAASALKHASWRRISVFLDARAEFPIPPPPAQVVG